MADRPRSNELLVRVQELLAPHGVVRHRVRSGYGYFLNGRLVARVGNRSVLIRVGHTDLAQAMRSPNAALGKMRSGATMQSFVQFAKTADDRELAVWLGKAVTVVRRLVGVEVALTKHFSLFSEYKLDWTGVNAPISGGYRVHSTFVTNQLLAGLSLKLG